MQKASSSDSRTAGEREQKRVWEGIDGGLFCSASEECRQPAQGRKRAEGESIKELFKGPRGAPRERGERLTDGPREIITLDHFERTRVKRRKAEKSSGREWGTSRR